jgi:signal transduction histidine kinase
LLSKNKLRNKVFGYLVLFALTLIAFLWIFQVTTLPVYYEWTKTRKMKSEALTLKTMYEDNYSDDEIDLFSYENEVCVEIVSYGVKTYPSTNNISCLIITKGTTYKKDFIDSGLDMQYYILHNDKYDSQILIYGIKLDSNSYAFLAANVAPIGPTVQIITEQLIVISISIIVLSLLIAAFISRRLSEPIVKLEKDAHKLSDPESEFLFSEDSGIYEIDSLAKTLNNSKTELAKTEQLRREFLANVSHDLKTPLTMIKAYSEMARDLNCGKKVKRNQNLNVIIDEADRLNLLVNDILKLSRLQANVDQVNLEEIKINHFIRDILNKYDYLGQDGYSFNFIAKKNYTIFADEKRLGQVLFNLINNAVNYAGDDKVTTIRLSDKQDTILVEIIDTGVGIKENELENIWEKYYKVNKKYKRTQVGTGIGLSIVKNILDNYHQNYGVRSKVGSGTTFYFELEKVKEKETKKRKRRKSNKKK